MAHKLRWHKVEKAEFYIPWAPRFLTYEDVGEIQRCYVNEDMTYREISELMGVSTATTSKCVRAVRADLVKLGEKAPRSKGQHPRKKLG